MKAPVKPCFLLFCLVLGIYVMRDSGISFGTAIKAPLRMLLGPKPSESLCKSIDINQAFSESQLQRAADIRASVKTMRGGNPLLDLLTSNDLFGQLMPVYVMPTIQYIAPWPILFLLSILTFICIGCNWCCIYGCCKNTKCCKCCKEPKDSGRARIYVAFSVIFLLGVTGVAIAGIIVGTQIGTGIEVTICSILSTVEDFEYGVPTQKWLGVDGTVTSLKNLLTGFDTAVATMSQSSSNMGTVNTNLGNVKTQLNTMITNVNALTKPTRAAPDQAGTYTPTYGANIGPATSSSSFAGAIQAECQTRYDILNTAQTQINNAVTALTSPATKTGIKAGIQSGVDVTDGISLKIQDLLNSVVQYGGISKDVIKAVGSALTGIFISNLVLGLGTLGSILLVGCCKKNFFNKFLLSNTFMMLALTILGWFIVTIFYPLSLIMLEGCDVLDQVLVIDGTPAQKQASQDLMGKIVSTLTNGNGSPSIINQCLYGNGEIVQQFGLDAGLKDFRAIFDQFNNVQTTAGMKIDNVSPPSVTIPYQQDLVSKWKVGTLPDADETVTDLTALNSATNKNNNPCTSVYDTWQLNSGTCVADAGYKFVSTDADTKNKGSPVCIGLEAWTASPPVHTITNRYTAAEFPGSCANRGGTSALTYVQSFVPKFQTNRNKVDTYFGSVQSELTNVANKYQTFADSMKPVLNDFKNLNTTLGGVYDSLAGSNGLLTNLNCKFVATDLKRVSNAMCIGFIATLYQTSIVIIVTSVMTFFASICVFCLGKRFILPKPGGEGKVV